MSDDLLARVRILLDADSSRFEQGIRDSDRSAEAGFDNIKSNAVLMGTTVATAAAAATVSLVTMAKESALAVVQTEKLAQMAGVSAKEMSVLQFAGQGIGLELDRVGDVVVDFNERIADAALGNTDALNAFKALDIQILDSNGNLRDAVSVMTDVAEKFSEMEDGAAKNLISTRLGGDAFREFIPFLNQGAEGLKSATAEAERLGIALDDKAIKAAKDFESALSTTDISVQALKSRLLIELTPVLTELVTKFNSATVQSDVLASTVDSVTNSLSWLVNNLDLVSDAAVVAGVVIGTTRLRALVIATYEVITAAKAKFLADGQAMVAEELRTGVILRNARALSAETAAEVNAARAAVASATTTTQLTAAKLRLTEARVLDAAATRATTVAENANTAAKNAGRVSVGGLIGVLTGPVGLAVTLGTVAAGYLLMGRNSSSARVEVERMTGSVREQVIELRRLNLAKQQSVLEQARLDKLQGLNEAKGATVLIGKNLGSSSKQEFNSQNDRLGIRQSTDEYTKSSKALQNLSDQFAAGKIKVDDYYQSAVKHTEGNKLARAELDKWYNVYDSGIKKAGNALTTEKAIQEIRNGSTDKSVKNADIVLSKLNALDNAESNSAKSAKAASDSKAESVNSVTQAYNTQISTLNQQISMIGLSGDLAKIQYELQAGSLAKLSSAQKDHVLLLAQELDLKQNQQAYKDHLLALDQEIMKLKILDPIARELKDLELDKYKDLLPAQQAVLLSKENEILVMQAYKSIADDLKSDELFAYEALTDAITNVNKAYAVGIIDAQKWNEQSLSLLMNSSDLGDFKYEKPISEEEELGQESSKLELAYLREKEVRELLHQDRVITEDQKNLSLLALEERYQNQKRQIQDASESVSLRNQKRDRATMVNFYQQSLDSIANSNSKHADKAKKIQKAMALYQIGKDTYAAAIASYKALAGIPFVGPALGFAAAAAAIAFGGMQAKAVMSDSDATGSISTPSASSGVTPNSEQPAMPTQMTTIQIREDTLFTGRQMVDLLNEAIADGKRLNADAVSFIGT